MKLLSYNGIATNAWTRFADGLPGYEVSAPGFKYNMTDMDAALGLPQLPLLEERWTQRERLWLAYNQCLTELANYSAAGSRPRKSTRLSSLHSAVATGKVSVGRQQILAAMEAENIGVGIHYEPVHAQPFYRQKFGYRDADFPNATYIGERTISLPLTAGMTEDDVSDVCRAFARILRYYAA